MAENHTSTETEKSEVLVSGSCFDEKYTILELIGTGAYGRVYKARHEILNDFCAVKVLKHELVQNEERLARFKREALIASKLRHPHLMQMRAFGITPEGLPYLVMDYLDGTALSDWVRAFGPLAIPRFKKIFLDLLDALAYAHENSVIHRDIKPANLILLENDNAKLIDLGLAKIYEDELTGAETITKTGDIAGTPLYMSPEQCKGAALTPASDIYSIGIVMFELLCGVPPFQGDTDYLVMQSQLKDEPKFPDGTLLPASLKKLILNCLAKDPAKRPASARTIAERLAAIDPDEKPVAEKAFINRKILAAASVLTVALTFALAVIASKMWIKPTDSNAVIKKVAKKASKPAISKRITETRSSDDLIRTIEKKRHESHHSANDVREREIADLASTAIKKARSEGIEGANNVVFATVLLAEHSPEIGFPARIEILTKLEAEIAKAKEITPEAKSRLYECLGGLYFENRQYELAKQAYKTSAALVEEKKVRGLKAAMDCCYALGNGPELLRLMQELKKDPNVYCSEPGIEAHTILAQYYADHEKWSDLRKIIKQVSANSDFIGDRGTLQNLGLIAETCDRNNHPAELQQIKDLIKIAKNQIALKNSVRSAQQDMFARTTGQRFVPD